ncbi:unnamed protein product [Linum trigynum]|uniref:Uncharacterized protein n=1 Tax=Linum trigynum TaxID=586398 RepID=A0AAV2FBH2_9ROSI
MTPNQGSGGGGRDGGYGSGDARGSGEQGSLGKGGRGQRPMAGPGLGSSGPNSSPGLLTNPTTEEIAALRDKAKMSGYDSVGLGADQGPVGFGPKQGGVAG